MRDQPHGNEISVGELGDVLSHEGDLADSGVPGMEGIAGVTRPVSSWLEATVQHDSLGPAADERVARAYQQLVGANLRDLEVFELDSPTLPGTPEGVLHDRVQDGT